MTEFIENYYSGYDEDSRLLSRHGQVEFLTTMRYIKKYLKSGMRVLEIGAGTGRYSRALADCGYCVDAVELVEHNVKIFTSKLTPEQNITITQGNASNLYGFNDDFYDITLLLGPMYHLYTEEEKLQALSEALRVTKKGGVLFAAYCMSDASIMDYGFIDGHILELIEKGMLETERFKTFSRPVDLFELYRKEDIDSLVAQLDVTRLHYLATDLYTNHMRETVDSMSDEVFNIYLRYHFHICERPDMMGLTHHSLDVLRKN